MGAAAPEVEEVDCRGRVQARAADRHRAQYQVGVVTILRHCLAGEGNGDLLSRVPIEAAQRIAAECLRRDAVVAAERGAFDLSVAAEPGLGGQPRGTAR